MVLVTVAAGRAAVGAAVAADMVAEMEARKAARALGPRTNVTIVISTAITRRGVTNLVGNSEMRPTW